MEHAPPDCTACGRPAHRLVHAYWGDLLCGDCCVRIADALDEGERWPAAYWSLPWPAATAFLSGTHFVLEVAEGSVQAMATAPWPRDFAELAAAVNFKATEVWITAAAMHRLGHGDSECTEAGASIPDLFMNMGAEWTCNLEVPGFAPYALWTGPGGQRIALHIPCLDRKSPFNDRAPKGGGSRQIKLHHEVKLFHAATKGELTWKGTPAITSDAWLRRHYKRRDLTTQEPPVATPLVDMGPFWYRAPTDAERAMKGIVGFDLNLAYVSAASSIPLGIGDLVHLEEPEVEEKRPGYWRIDGGAEYKPYPRCFGVQPWGLLPPPINPDGWVSEAWVTTPVAHFLAREFEIWPSEAWVWTSTGRFLTPWYELLRDARAALLPASGGAMEAVKATGRAGLGRLASQRRSERTEDLYLPYWNRAVVAESRIRLLRRLRRLERPPFAMNVDAVYFATDRRQPELAAAELGIPLGDGFGEFKPIGKGPAGELAPVLAAIDAGETFKPFFRLLAQTLKGIPEGE